MPGSKCMKINGVRSGRLGCSVLRPLPDLRGRGGIHLARPDHLRKIHIPPQSLHGSRHAPCGGIWSVLRGSPLRTLLTPKPTEMCGFMSNPFSDLVSTPRDPSHCSLDANASGYRGKSPGVARKVQGSNADVSADASTLSLCVLCSQSSPSESRICSSCSASSFSGNIAQYVPHACVLLSTASPC